MEPVVEMRFQTNEVSIKNNGLPEGQFTINPRFTRKTGFVDKDTAFTELGVEIVNTEEHPFPVDICVNVTGFFKNVSLAPEQEEVFLKVNAVQILYPYLRSIVSTITTASMFPPIILPVIDVSTLFPEDQVK